MEDFRKYLKAAGYVIFYSHFCFAGIPKEVKEFIDTRCALSCSKASPHQQDKNAIFKGITNQTLAQISSGKLKLSDAEKNPIPRRKISPHILCQIHQAAN